MKNNKLSELYSNFTAHLPYLLGLGGCRFVTIDLKLFLKHLTCNCDFDKLEKYDFEKVKYFFEDANTRDRLKNIQNMSYDFNLICGYLKEKLDEKEIAYELYTEAINKNGTCDISYSLRGLLSKKINPNYLEDLKMAALLNPSPRNLFMLAQEYAESKSPNDLNKSLHFYTRAIEKNPQFGCAYNNRGIIKKELGSYYPLDDYKKSLEVDPENKYALFNICSNLYAKDRINSELLEYSKIGYSRYPDKSNYIYFLGVGYHRIGNLDKAIDHYKSYLRLNPDHEKAKRRLENATIKYHFDKAVQYYVEEEYKKALKFFEKVIDQDPMYFLHEEDTDKYFISLLRVNSTNIELGVNSPIYKKIMDSREKNEWHSFIYMQNDEFEDKDIFIFGKYKGESIDDIVNSDPDYILWCIINVDKYLIDPSLMVQLNIRDSKNYLKAVKYYVIKMQILDQYEEELYEYYKSRNSNYVDLGDTMSAEEANQAYWNTH